MSFLMPFKGELVTDPGWGLLYVIMGSGQSTLVPLSPTLFFFCLKLGKGMRRGECPKRSPWGRHRHTEPKTCEPWGPSLPMCHNPVLKHFLHSCPSLAPSHAPPVAMPTGRVLVPSTPALCGGYLSHQAFSESEPKLLFG